LRNTQISNPKEAREDAIAEGRSPYLLWLIWVLWLPFMIPAFLSLFQAHFTIPRLIAILVGAALFLVIYLWSSWRRALSLVATSSIPGHPNASTWLTIAALTLLSLVLVLLGGSAWLGLFFYTCGYIGGSLPVRWTILMAVAIALLATAVGWFTGIGWLNLIQTVVFIPAIILITRVVMWSITTNWALGTARKEIARLAVTTERLRIARDLHDLLGHNLSLITLKSELAGRLVRAAPERAAAEIGDIERVARTTLQEVREAVAFYRQPTLSSELQAAQEILDAAGIAYHYESDESSIDDLPATVEATLSWAVREGVTNVIRHSRAQQCTIRLTRDAHKISVEVIDDGAGASSTPTTGNIGNGLHGLAERVEALGGQCEASPLAGGGFRLAVSVPLVQRDHNALKPNSNATAHSQQASIDAPLEASSNAERSEQR
jgi:two-component system, NarL family, sensor histidine kinase DesK